MTDKLMQKVFDHAEECYPRESCGLMVMIRRKKYYRPCRNVKSEHEVFEISAEDYSRAEDEGVILQIVHSHCNRNATPSEADRVACENTGLPWMIVSWPTKQVVEFEPTGYEMPLVGREFIYGLVDCYTVIQDYFLRETGILLPDIKRPKYGWWKRGEDFYLDNFEEAGFVKTDRLEKHSVILMQLHSDVANHAGVYVGENMMLHHPEGRLSTYDFYGDYWEKYTRNILKHKDIPC